MDKKSDQNNSASFEDAQDSPARFDDCVDNDYQGKYLKFANNFVRRYN
jgi:hypothetical protein